MHKFSILFPVFQLNKIARLQKDLAQKKDAHFKFFQKNIVLANVAGTGDLERVRCAVFALKTFL